MAAILGSLASTFLPKMINWGVNKLAGNSQISRTLNKGANTISRVANSKIVRDSAKAFKEGYAKNREYE